MKRADYSNLVSQRSWASGHGARQQAVRSRLLSEESRLNDPLLFILVKLLDMSRQLPDSIYSCPISQVAYRERSFIEIQILQNQNTDRLEAIDEAKEVKKISQDDLSILSGSPKA